MTININKLNGPQRKIVRDAFLDAFDAAKLTMLLQDSLNKRFDTLVAPASFEVMVFNLINVSRYEGWTDQLIKAAAQSTMNARIRGLLQDLETSEAIDLIDIDNRVKVSSPASGGLERIVRDNGGFADWGMWVNRMTEIGRRICRIEYPVGLKMGGGTGFLVAPDLVLTNYHVIEKHERGKLDFSNILCRFDFAAGFDANTPVKLAAECLVDFSSYSPHDPGDIGGLPDVNHLDYALLRLDRAVGDETVSGVKRGWIPLNAAYTVPSAKSILFIGQHPNLEPLKLGVGAIIGLNGNSTRIRYDTNTERGSSGSPCLDVGLNAVALHHGGDPDYSKLLGEFNQGVPLSLILGRMAKQGVTKFWSS